MLDDIDLQVHEGGSCRWSAERLRKAAFLDASTPHPGHRRQLRVDRRVIVAGSDARLSSVQRIASSRTIQSATSPLTQLQGQLGQFRVRGAPARFVDLVGLQVEDHLRRRSPACGSRSMARARRSIRAAVARRAVRRARRADAFMQDSSPPSILGAPRRRRWSPPVRAVPATAAVWARRPVGIVASNLPHAHARRDLVRLRRPRRASGGYRRENMHTGVILGRHRGTSDLGHRLSGGSGTAQRTRTLAALILAAQQELISAACRCSRSSPSRSWSLRIGTVDALGPLSHDHHNGFGHLHRRRASQGVLGRSEFFAQLRWRS